MNVILRLPHLQSGDSQGHKTFLAACPDKQIRNHDIYFTNHHPFLSTLSPKGLSHSKIKSWLIYKNLPVNVIVRPQHPRSGGTQGQETFSAPSADNQTRNHDIECSNQDSSLSTLRPKGLSRSKIKWWAIYTNLSVNVIVGLPHPQSRDRKRQETFLAPSAE